jgi:hypothetical protein
MGPFSPQSSTVQELLAMGGLVSWDCAASGEPGVMRSCNFPGIMTVLLDARQDLVLVSRFFARKI